MTRRATALAATTLALLATVLSGTSLAASKAPAWRLTATPAPTNFAPGGTSQYFVIATNVGGSATSGAATIEATLPADFTPVAANGAEGDPSTPGEPVCTIAKPTITCTTPEPIPPARLFSAAIAVSVPPVPAEASARLEAEVSGGGIAGAVAKTFETPIQPNPLAFDFLAGEAGLSAPITDAGGEAVTQAGARPYQITVDTGFPTENLGGGLTGAGHLRDLSVDLPRGLIGDPAATPVLCTEAELTSEGKPGCPDSSQVGVVNVTSVLSSNPTAGGVALLVSNLYNMVPPPGAVAEFGLEAGNSTGVFVHLVAGVRSEGDYGVRTTSHDILALGNVPIFNIDAQVWGDPSSSSHDEIRGQCAVIGTPPTCPVAAQKTPFLITPGDCPGEQLTYEAQADSWEEPGVERDDEYKSADLAGNPVSIEDCEALEFEPTIKAKPTTNVADSPSGLDFELFQPQNTDLETNLESDDPEASPPTATVKDLSISFPPGMSVNASSGDGLGACSEGQIGFAPSEGKIHFTNAPQSCPEASKLGTVEASTPLLARRNEEHAVEVDPETGKPIAEPLHGAIYLAKPFENPFNSLIAVYIVIEDPKTGVIAKLASEVEADPVTGQLTTTVTENPEVPLEAVRVHLFEGPRAGLQTPPACGSYTTTSDLTPWSETPTVHPTDSFAITASPSGGSCPTSGGGAPNAPSLRAGTISPQAGAFSPMVVKLTRQDGSQRMARLDLSLPQGISAKLAGVAECSEAQIAAAQARNHPNEGALERAHPSCPAGSEIGVVDVAAGAGPTPLHVQGHVYMAGPYRGAPFSLVTITPAVAGPFDLGAVVVRAPVYVDPVTARARAVSDPFPQILDGILLDVRSISVRAERPNFTLNPTSCDEKSFNGSLVSALGSIAPLFERFQVGGCQTLPYKPKLSTRLSGPIHRGGHPSLRAVFTAKPGEAGTARISFALPHSEFIDQAHFRTICTRVQFSAGACPAGSIYGHVRAFTPLFDYPLEGPIYLRSSNNKLPDVVFALRGPPSQPLEVDLDGRVDSVHGGLRTTFAEVPDAPVSKAIVTMQGGKKGLFQNSTNICKGIYRATLKLDGQNGKASDSQPMLKAGCKKGAKGKRKGARRHRR
jgi:hypothetical protein